MNKDAKISATVIDGKKSALKLQGKICNHVKVLNEIHDIIPGLAVVLVGEDPASQIYVKHKERMTQKLGMNSFIYRLPAKTSQDEVLRLICDLNNRDDVNGILVQLPLPKQIDTFTVLKELSPVKDVDGLHFENVGRLAAGRFGLVPCTPLGCLMLLKETLGDLSGQHAVVIGRSSLVGKPMAQLLLKENCTVTMAHSRTIEIEKLTATADIVVVATGQAKMVNQDWIKPGATIIDVGINRLGVSSLVGDVDFESVAPIAGAITPVPGGVGPMTIACLMANTLTATCRQHELALPDLN